MESLLNEKQSQLINNKQNFLLRHVLSRISKRKITGLT